MKIKQRLDKTVQFLYPNLSRQLIQSLIMQGKVTVNDIVATKMGMQVSDIDTITVTDTADSYASRAGNKLAHALSYFKIDVSGLVSLDAGISTGGFTDCLLRNGVSRVYGIDVGYGQTINKIRSDPRVILYEKTNLRYITKETIGELVDLVTLDLSFISILKVLDAVKSVLKPNGMLVALIKPQFEAEKHEVGTGGIIRDTEIRERIIQQVIQGITDSGFICHGFCPSTVQGTDGNQEYVAYFNMIK